MKSISLHDLFAGNLLERPDKVFLIDPDREATYAEIDVLASRLTAHLLARGIGPGDRIVVQVGKSIGEVVVLLAILRAGAVIVNVSSTWPRGHILFIAQDCRAALLIIDPDAALDLLQQGCDADRLLSVSPAPGLEGLPTIADLAEGSAEPVARRSGDLAAVIYTLDPAGMPSGIMFSNHALVQAARSVADHLGLTCEDRIMSILPYSIEHGFTQLTTMMLVGGSVVHQTLVKTSEFTGVVEPVLPVFPASDTLMMYVPAENNWISNGATPTAKCPYTQTVRPPPPFQSRS